MTPCHLKILMHQIYQILTHKYVNIGPQYHKASSFSQNLSISNKYFKLFPISLFIYVWQIHGSVWLTNAYFNRRQQPNYLNVFDYFLWLVLKRLKIQNRIKTFVNKNNDNPLIFL